MMFKKTDHLTDKELICFIDGETSTRASDRIQKHLAACLSCHARKLSLENAATEFAGLHRTSISPATPSEDALRSLLKTQLAAAGKSAPTSLFERFSIHRWIYLYAAAVVMVAIGIALFDREGHFSQAHSFSAQLESRLLPDSGLTPGVARPVELSDICPQADDDLDPAVSSSVKKVVFQEYGMGDTPSDDYQVDYLINPQLGGTDDVRNLWPEPYGSKVWNARAKDALESHLHRMVCDRQIDLKSAQHDIATNWIAAYKKYFHTANPA